LRRVYNKKKIVILLDNATMHHSILFKNLAKALQVYFLFNAPHSSRINQIEYLFEYVKRDMRNSDSLGYRQTLEKFIRNRMNEIKYVKLDHQNIRYYTWLQNAIHQQNFWK
jgi:transposase